jgi:hypothetical protein
MEEGLDNEPSLVLLLVINDTININYLISILVFDFLEQTSIYLGSGG